MKKRGVIDDLILYRLGETEFLLVVNASCVEKDVAWLGEHVVDGVMLCNERSEWAGLAIQGAQAPKFFSAITDGRTLPTRNGVDDLQHEGRRIVICRTGYTGEDGFELFARRMTPLFGGMRSLRRRCSHLVWVAATACG